MATKKAVGRPPKYKSKEEIEEKIEEYFKECEGEILKDDEGKPIFNKYGSPVVIQQRPPTVTGLALALGFTSRQALLNYQAKKEFVDTITRAKSRVEAYAEERLFDRDGTSGAQFSLRNNFKGWTEKTELDEEEQQARIELNKARKEAITGENENHDAIDRLDSILEELRNNATEQETE